MKISTKSKNATTILAFMACFDKGSVVPMDKIEEKTGISPSYSAQILAELKKDGIIESKMGVGGGYYIPKEIQLEEITVGDVCRAVEKDMFVVECVFDTSKCELGKNAYSCGIRNAMCDISDAVFDALDSFYIVDIAELLLDNGFVNKNEYIQNGGKENENVSKKQIWNAWLY